MKLYIEKEQYKLYQGNMLDMLEVIEPNSIDSIVCDPPYGLTSITKRFGKENSVPAQQGKDGSFARLSKGFMGKEWDGSGIEYNIETWQKCYEVLKPGGYLLAFGGTRTYHRIACAIEDAGFEIRDCIMYLYGSGFPKSHNIGLAIDKKMGCPDRGHRIATASRFHPDGTFEPNGETIPPYEAKTNEGSKWQGWGTALKPAYEPIIVARKPFKTSVAENIMQYGVGGINIDECRVPAKQGEYDIRHYINEDCFQNKKPKESKFQIEEQPSGRFPANVIHDGSEEVIKDMPNTNSTPRTETIKGTGGIGQVTNFQRGSETSNFSDSGSASRYFYTSKASKKDRDEGLDMFDSMQVNDGRDTPIDNAFQRGDTLRKNIHPTVKPVELMQYLIRLVTPKNGTILDCFMGSGSTGKATMFENRERNANYKFIGIELTEEYLPICEARIDYALNKYEYDFKKELEESKKEGQQNIFDMLGVD
jgi:site-specific DNA-methyltransferase (adenine-specific)